MKIGLRNELEVLIKKHKTTQISPKEISIRPSIEKKRIVIEEIKKLLATYRTLILLDNTSTPSKLYLYLRQRYGDIFYVKMVKNTLLLKALNELGMANIEELSKYLKGSIIALFTNLNPFEAKILLDKISIPFKIKPGEKIEYEIIIPPMRTELKPGPAMSLFGKLKIPIQVKDGVIWIMRESVIAKPGDIATPELISIFDKLGIEPKFLRPRISIAYEHGLVIPIERLVIDINGTKNNIADAVKNALSLAVELVIPEPSIIRMSLTKAYLKMCSLAIELGIVSKETAPIIVSTAVKRTYILASILAQKIPELASLLPSTAIQIAKTEEIKSEKPSEEKKEGKEVSEEQLAEGLASLFG